MEVEKLSWWSADQSDGSRERGAGSGGGGGMGRRRDTRDDGGEQLQRIPSFHGEKAGKGETKGGRIDQGKERENVEVGPWGARKFQEQQKQRLRWKNRSSGGVGSGNTNLEEAAVWDTKTVRNKQEVDGMSVAHEKWAKPGPGAVHQAPESRDAATSIVGEGSLQETRENGKTDSWLLRGMPAGEAVRAQTSWGRFQDDSGYTTGLGQRIIPISSDSIQRGSQEGRQGQRQWVRRIRKEAGSMRVQSNKCKQVSPHLGWRIALVHGPAQGGLRASGGRAKVLAAQDSATPEDHFQKRDRNLKQGWSDLRAKTKGETKDDARLVL
ncbi:hypothetical protein DFH07DRAFT_1017012 [Mycena maculata]|uniref:Uncharacterized protein n=1 Tax=Mycena maculata TaxID=230809 RepID=A0AAD7JJS7_9AGAR|nr:hypothetical protein DFH07DRAFT_1017012 [Mycena maculata]